MFASAMVPAAVKWIVFQGDLSVGLSACSNGAPLWNTNTILRIRTAQRRLLTKAHRSFRGCGRRRFRVEIPIHPASVAKPTRQPGGCTYDIAGDDQNPWADPKPQSKATTSSGHSLNPPICTPICARALPLIQAALHDRRIERWIGFCGHRFVSYKWIIPPFLLLS
jgi:hypothetical protein